MVDEVAPVIDEHERERRFPIEIVRRIGEMGWLGIPIPEDEGGAGLDTLAYAIAIEEIGRVWGSLGLIVAAHTSLGCGPLHLAGTPDQQERFLVPMAQGRGHRRVRADRARRRQRLRRHAHDRPPRGRPRRRLVGHRRRQALHHQRRPGGDVHRHGPDRDPTTTAARRSARSSSRPTRPGFSRGAARGQAGPARLGDRRAAVRRRPRPGGEHARRAGERLQDVPEDPRRRADQHRGAGGRARPGGARRVRSRTRRRASSSAGRSAPSRASRS